MERISLTLNSKQRLVCLSFKIINEKSCGLWFTPLPHPKKEKHKQTNNKQTATKQPNYLAKNRLYNFFTYRSADEYFSVCINGMHGIKEVNDATSLVSYSCPYLTSPPPHLHTACLVAMSALQDVHIFVCKHHVMIQ